VFVGCASADFKGTGGTGQVGFGDGGHHRFVADSGLLDASHRGDGGRPLNPLCGTIGFCGGNAPDDAFACAEADGSPGGSGVGKDGGRKDAGPRESSDASSDAAPSTDATVADAAAIRADDADAKAPSRPDPLDASVEASQVPSSSASGPRLEAGLRSACQVSAADNGGPFHQCQAAGNGGRGAPCVGPQDCSPSLACVGTAGAGQCLPYCCDPATECGQGAFCAVRPLLIPSASTATPHPVLQVPVCAPADGCSLDEVYPCTGSSCRCGEGTACAIVRSDGTTACVKPGTGKSGQPCPPGGPSCAAGYFCSEATSICVKLCNTSPLANGCDPGKCQATAGFPSGFGLCIGPTPTR
jgi:hypothetical protein